MLVVLSIISLTLSELRSSNNRLYICEFDKFFEDQRNRMEERLMKTIFLGFVDRLNVGVSSPKAPKNGGGRPSSNNYTGGTCQPSLTR
jgi:hypothetical protein